MDLFQTGYDPAEWELVSNRSDGEYLSLTEDDSDSPHNCNYDSDNSEISTVSESLNFLDIKMFSPEDDIPSPRHRQSVIQTKLSQLTPGQFQLSKRLNAQLSSINSQLAKHQ
jgi:hypothetical protein